MLSQAAALEGGFNDPVMDAQTTFKSLMDAVARPTLIVEVKPSAAPAKPLLPVAGAIAATLIDADTPYWLDETLDNEGLNAWLSFHTGAAKAASMDGASFVLIGDPLAMPKFECFGQGTQEYPDNSATLILQVEALEGGTSLVFEGPGVEGRATFAPVGLPPDFAHQWVENRARFPRGVDLILVAGDAIACLPRSAMLISGED